MGYHSTSTKNWHMIIIALIIIGFISQLIRSPLSILIPLAIIGIVIYLFKRPPQWLQNLANKIQSPSMLVQPPQAKRANKKKKRSRRLRVINGNK